MPGHWWLGRRLSVLNRRGIVRCGKSSGGGGPIGFNKPANPDVTATQQTAINKINAMAQTGFHNPHRRFESALEAG
jgi:hypothetical protein